MLKRCLYILCIMLLALSLGCSKAAQKEVIVQNSIMTDDENIYAIATMDYIKDEQNIEFDIIILSKYEMESSKYISNIHGVVYEGDRAIKSFDLKSYEGYDNKLLTRKEFAEKVASHFSGDNMANSFLAGGTSTVDAFVGSINLKGEKIDNPHIVILLNREERFILDDNSISTID